ncbi:hypothetical protein [Aquimarina pacifica]|uniref:hypothetical protein n=1 Tax=Aquimarina pacifica TaxID=1296415 RepID=UPI00046FF339|nr:hypothetical protein [Aquimarina pacifica]
MAVQKKAGCFSFPAIVLIATVGSGFLTGFLPISTFFAFIVLLYGLSIVFGRSSKENTSRFSWRFVIYSTFLLIALVGVRYMLSDFSLDQSITPDITENISRENFFENGDSIVVLRQDRQWKDNYGNSFSGRFLIREKEYFSSKKEYASAVSFHQNHSWGELYQYLATTDTPRLDLILDELKKIKDTNSLNQFEFAEMVVTFIQDIPYAFVFSEACKSPENYEKTIKIALEKCPSCCIGQVPFGIQNPVGFMGNLKGDCDTRTVIIYAILSYFNYDVAILNSDYYKHSVLGLNIPSKGKFIAQKGKRYYVWETTNKFFTIGTLPSNFDNINHWYIVLTNN